MKEDKDILSVRHVLANLKELAGQLVAVRGRLRAAKDEMRLLDVVNGEILPLGVSLIALDKADTQHWAFVGGPMTYDYEAVVTGKLDSTGLPIIFEVHQISLLDDEGHVNELAFHG